MNRIVQIVVLLVFPPLLQGVINKTKALFAGRVGPPVLQPYYDLLRLFRKNCVTSRTTTWVFLAGPAVGLVTATLAGLLVPMGRSPGVIGFTGDLILFAYLLGLGRFFTAAAALDTGSAFEGMGSAREVTFACLAEPALFLALLVLARVTGSLSLSGMLNLSGSWSAGGAALVLVMATLLIVLLAENSRIPFDDPNTHLELTMIHEVMVLDHSGPGFGMILYGAALKLFVLAAVLARVAAPVQTGSAWLDWAVFLGVVLGIAVVIGVVESVMARLRLLNVPKLLISASLLSGLGFLLVVTRS